MSTMSRTSWQIHDDMNLYLTEDKFIVEPMAVTSQNEVFVINKYTLDSSLEVKTTQIPRNTQVYRKVCGILGNIKLIGGHYLIVATHRLFIGMINSQAIWRLAGIEILPYMSTTALNETQKQQNEYYLDMMKQLLDTPYLYFSYTYDLTHSLQRLNSMSPEFLQMGLLERADMRFVWNGFLLKPFQKPHFRQYCLPLILGFVAISDINVNEHQFSWSIISRRSIQRAGTRLFYRGIDQNGHVANFVETEQIVEYSGDRIGFVQTRGSIPLYWRQMPNLKYKPAPQLDTLKDHQTACLKHLETQVMQYGRQVLVNLIDQRGPEDILEKAFSQTVAVLNMSNVRYEAFDFHAECKKMRWDRLNILIDRLAHEQEDFAVFHLRRDGMLISSQDGVFRTNCIDCLDRTNVVQSMLAKRSLQSTLQKLGILHQQQKIEDFLAFEMLFKAVWADNADMISVQYSGTSALKTDFTRTGKRTKAGLVQDGINSLTRYVKNNFMDGFRQDAIDLFLGNYVVQDGEGVNVPCPISNRGFAVGTTKFNLTSVLGAAIVMFSASILLPHEYDTFSLLFLLFWGSMIGFSVYGIFKYNFEFVDWPKLVPPTENYKKKTA